LSWHAFAARFGKFDLKDKPGSAVLKVPGFKKKGNVAIGYKNK
jgi:conserved domain protein